MCTVTKKSECPILCERYCSLNKLIHITAYVLKFVRILKSRLCGNKAEPSVGLLSLHDIDSAKHYCTDKFSLSLQMMKSLRVRRNPSKFLRKRQVFYVVKGELRIPHSLIQQNFRFCFQESIILLTLLF